MVQVVKPLVSSPPNSRRNPLEQVSPELDRVAAASLRQMAMVMVLLLTTVTHDVVVVIT